MEFFCKFKKVLLKIIYVRKKIINFAVRKAELAQLVEQRIRNA